MEFTLVFHSIIRWAILLFGAWTVINALTGLASKRPYSANDNRSSLFFMIFCDVQLILGLILLFSNTWIDKIKSGMGPLMKDPTNRFFVVEHGMMMMIAWVLVHIGRSAVKKTTPENKHKKMLVFFGLAFLIIIISIPWPNRTEVARPLIRWFN
jgi:hypothetical protein